jgi:hypothetical protein
MTPGASYLSKSRDTVQHQKPEPGTTWDLVGEKRRARGKLQSIRAEKQDQLLASLLTLAIFNVRLLDVETEEPAAGENRKRV